MTDNHLSLQTLQRRRQAMTALGTKHVFTKPHCPRQNGNVERYNRILHSKWTYLRSSSAKTNAPQPLNPGCSSTTLDDATQPSKAHPDQPTVMNLSAVHVDRAEIATTHRAEPCSKL